MHHSFKKIFIAAAIIYLLTTSTVVYAEAVDFANPNIGGTTAPPNITGSTIAPTSGTGVQVVPLQNPLDPKFNSVGSIIGGFIEIITYLAILLAVIMLIWTGLMYVLARGNTEQLKEQSKRLGYILIGVAIVLAARVIITIVINTLQASGTVNSSVIQSAQNTIGNN